MGQCYIQGIRSIILIIQGENKWDTQKNIGEEEKSAPKKEEHVKEVRENKLYSGMHKQDKANKHLGFYTTCHICKPVPFYKC